MSELTSIARIWQNDSLARRADADRLQAFIESVAHQQLTIEDGKAFTLSVDAPYGVGKSFFLRALAEQMSLTHPVAYVDAWADDLMDDPLTAVAATLKAALGEHLKSGPFKQKWADVSKKIGVVATSMAVGAATQLASVVVGATASEIAKQALSAAPDTFRETAIDGAGDLGESIVDGAKEALKRKRQETLEERIEAFEARKGAVKALRASLSSLVSELSNTAQKPPIVIIVDELDRCRPTYAIKLLEEIKHLFDVPGLVFVFGMNGDQLAKSVVGAYGPEFDGSGYLRRFINRAFRLPDPDLSALTDLSLKNTGIDLRRFRYPKVIEGGNEVELAPHVFIARCMRGGRLTARDVAPVVNILQTFCALTGRSPVFLPYLMPLITLKIYNVQEKFLISAQEYFDDKAAGIFYRDEVTPKDRDYKTINYLPMAIEIEDLASWRPSRNANYDDWSQAQLEIARLYDGGNGRPWLDGLPLDQYRTYVELVGQFDLAGDTDRKSDSQ